MVVLLPMPVPGLITKLSPPLGKPMQPHRVSYRSFDRFSCVIAVRFGIPGGASTRSLSMGIATDARHSLKGRPHHFPS